MTDNVPCQLESTATLSVAVEQFIEAKQAQRLSKNTLIDYKRTLRRMSEFIDGDPQMSEITPVDIRKFMNSLDTLSKKSLLNVHIGLLSLWHWANDEDLCTENIMRKVNRPRPEIRAIQPFSREEVNQMFITLGYSVEYSRPGKKPCSNRLLNYHRTRAMVLLLLDNGIRASELCNIRYRDFSDSKIMVFGKGSKERMVPISETTRDAINDYIKTERPGDPINSDDYIFVTKIGTPLNGDELYHLIIKVGKRAKVKAYPHKFRHTFAINFLRNGGNIYALQAILGHASLEMVKRYLAIAEADIEAVHLKASIVNCWNLGEVGIEFTPSIIC